MRCKLTLESNIFEDYAEKFEEMGELLAFKPAVEAGMKAAKAKVNEDIKKALTKPNMPKKGKYSAGRSKKAIDRKFDVKWSGSEAEILVGFSWDDRNIGWGTQVMIYGVPRQEPIKGLKEAIYGAKAKRHVKKEVNAALEKVMERIMRK